MAERLGSIKLFFLCVLCIALIGIVQAEDTQFLGTFPVERPVELSVVCTNETSTCQACNITQVSIPNSTIVLRNIVMLKNSAQYTFLLPENYTRITGIYLYSGFCTAGEGYEGFAGSFEISGAGDTLTVARSILYVIMLLFTLGLLLFTVGVAIKTPWRNERDEAGFVIMVNRKKYIKVFAVMMAYLQFLLLMWILYNVSYGYFNNLVLTSLFKIAYYLALIFLVPFVPMCFAYVVIKTIQDKKIINRISRGLDVR